MVELPANFRRIRLELAREPGHPVGSPLDGYEFAAPLMRDGHIDATTWKKHAEHCRVRRFRANEADQHGRLARKPGGSWYFDYDRGSDADDESGFRFNKESFQPGEYVSISEDEHMHTYQIVSVEPL